MSSSSSGTGHGSDTATPSPSPPGRSRANGGASDTKANISSLPASSLNHIPVDMGDTTNEEETATEDMDENTRPPEHVEWLDEIRFASYRTAAKLRLLQKRTGLVHIDIWNMIEAFRENGLTRTDSETLVQRPKIETLVGSIYSSLAKRLPIPQASSSGESGSNMTNTVNHQVETMASWLLSWLVAALAKTATPPSSTDSMNYDCDGSLKVRTLKTALAVLCSGKLMDKLRYIFSLLSDNNGHLIHDKYALFVKDVTCVPQAVGEQISRGSHSLLSPSPFENGSKVTVNDFLEALMSDPGPQCILWLPVLHRIATAENAVHHGISCGSCGDKEFRGLRYKSDKSAKYNLCQWCFWRGRIPPDHRDDVFKEYNSFKTPGASGSSSSSRFQCGGGKGTKSNFPKYPEVETPLDLSNMVPPSPLPSIRSNGAIPINEFVRNTSQYQSLPLPRRSKSRSDQVSSRGGVAMGENSHFDNLYPSVKQNVADTRQGFNSLDPNMVEDEHGLIAQYAQEIHFQGNIGQNFSGSQPSSIPFSNGSSGDLIVESEAEGKRAIQNSRQLVYELERKNQEIMHDIERLRKSHQEQKQHSQYLHQKGGHRMRNPQILSELQGLRSHKEELESRLDELQGARTDLMTELHELMKLLKVQEIHQGRSVPQQSFLRPAAPGVYGSLHDAERNNSFTNIAGLGLEQAFSGHAMDGGCNPQIIGFHEPQQAQTMQYLNDQLEHQQQPHLIYPHPQESIRPPVIGSNPQSTQHSSITPIPDSQPPRSSSQQRQRHRSSSATRKKSSSSATRKRSPSANSSTQRNSHQHNSRQSQDSNGKYIQGEAKDIGLVQSRSIQNSISGHS